MAHQEESPLRGLVTSLPALATLTIAIFGVILSSPKLESIRPTSVGDVPKRPLKAFEVEARLWQDPLANVLQVSQPNLHLESFANDRPEPVDGKKDQRILVFFVLIDLDQTPIGMEERRRERFAMLAALNTAGYVPVNSNLLSFVDIADKTPPTTTMMAKRQSQGSNYLPSQIKNKLRIPFEWIRPVRPSRNEQLTRKSDGIPPHYRGVCVAWIYEDINRSSPLASFAFLKEKLQDAIKTPCDFAITGRISSDRLMGILQDKPPEEATKPKDGERTKLFVTSSTAKWVRTFVVDHKTDLGLDLEYIIGSDDRLMKNLVDELKRREVSMTDDQIAIVAEWDTLYGRAMNREFIQAAAPHGPDRPQNIHCFSYLTGLDGKLPVRAAPEETPAGKGPDAPSEKPTVEGEGDAQLDYLRRLVERMNSNGKPFKAIGILGSDVYDKLLLLQALRPSFPQAFFFTTDLDVRMLQPKQSIWTRNVIVASHFGLSLQDHLQGEIPPFRSSYDTASYLAYLRAAQYPLLNKLVAADAGTDTKKDGSKTKGTINGSMLVKINSKDPLPVHLFEIGRGGAYELTSYRTTDYVPHPTERLNVGDDPVGAANYHRRAWLIEVWWRIPLMGLCASLFGVLLYPVSRTWQRFLDEVLIVCRLRPGPILQSVNDEQGKSAPVLTITAIVAVIAILMTALILWAHVDSDQEPFSILDGISVWPSVVLRLFAGTLCVYYIVAALNDLAKRNENVRKEFEFKDAVANPDAPPIVAWHRQCWHHCSAAWYWSPSDDTVASAWQQFMEHGRPFHRFSRCLLMVLANGLLFWLMNVLFDHSMLHGRGPAALWATRITLILTVALLFGLLSFVIDSTTLCYRFVTYLYRHLGGWSSGLLEKVANERGMNQTDESAGPDPVRPALEPLLMIRLIAATTEVVAGLIYYPFVVLLVVIVAQSPLFDARSWNLPLISIVVLSAGSALVCALLFHRAANNARRKALAALDNLALRLTGDANTESQAKLALIRAEIEGMDSGVFSSYAKNPIVGAVLLPLFGGGGLAALQAFLV